MEWDQLGDSKTDVDWQRKGVDVLAHTVKNHNVFTEVKEKGCSYHRAWLNSRDGRKFFDSSVQYLWARVAFSPRFVMKGGGAL